MRRRLTRDFAVYKRRLWLLGHDSGCGVVYLNTEQNLLTLIGSLWLPLAGVPHLDLPAFDNGSVQLFSGPVGLSRILKGHEAKSLQV